VDPGKTGYVDLDLGRGEYIAICFVSSPVTHQHHAEMGMFLPFTVG
jgi:hypothetical protein